MINLAKFLLKDYKINSSYPSISFFRRSRYGNIIWLKLMVNYYENNTLNVEVLARKIEKEASRKTVIDFIQKGIDAGFIERIKNVEDGRRYSITPSTITVKDFESWAINFKKNV